MTATPPGVSSLKRNLVAGFLVGILVLPSTFGLANSNATLLVEGAALQQSGETQAALSGEQVVDRVSPSVALILVGKGGDEVPRVGSGVVLRSEGVLFTAYHLLKDARAVQVRLKNGETYDHVELIAVDERRDVAALRIPAHGLPALPAANAEDARPGQTVYVVSNPGGLAWTATSGILSASRLADEVPGAGSGYRLLQFTAAVSPGSSGGALVDAQGHALGIVLTSGEGQNLNFAVLIESVLGLADSSSGTPLAPGSSLGLPKAEKPPAPEQQPAPPPAVKKGTDIFEIVRSARTVYVQPEEGVFGVPTEPLEKKLLEQPEFKSGEFIVTKERYNADLVILLSRKKLTWDFTYELIHTASGQVLGSGKVIAWDGVRAAPGLANQITKRLRALRQGPPPEVKKSKKG